MLAGLVDHADNTTVFARRTAILTVSLTLSAVLLVCGCSAFVAPSPSAGEMGDVVGALVLRGATITDQVGGDAGCSEPTLHSNAVRLDVRMPGESASVPVYLFRWKDRADYDAARSVFDSCVTEFGAANAAPDMSSVGVAPWRAYGPNWSAALNVAVNDALTQAAGI